MILSEGVNLLKGLNLPKALRPDELHPRVLKKIANKLGPYLFQKSLDTDEIPKEWPLANIYPLFGKGNTALAYNYRPVSLSSCHVSCLNISYAQNIMVHLDE